MPANLGGSTSGEYSVSTVRPNETGSKAGTMEANGFQRRQVAVMSADAVGYSRLMATDEDATLSRFMAFMEILTEIVLYHGGRTFGAAGDSIMAEFARPIEAVQAAVAVQAALADANGKLPESERLPFRLGITVGDVIAEKDRLFGDAVNIAARLQEIAGAGGIVVSEAVYSHAHALIDAAWEPLGDLQLKHIDHLVAAYGLSLGAELSRPAAAASPPVDVTAPVPGFAGRPAIAVLPFDSSHAVELEYLSDGLAEDLITGLSAVRSFPIIDRGSSFSFRGAMLDAGRIGRALGARYLVRGSVREVGCEVRITVSLVDAETGLMLWSAPFVSDRRQLAAVEDDVVHRVIATLDARIDMSEQARSRSRPMADLDAWGLVRRGMWHQNRLTRDDALEARRLFDLALQRDPGSVEALIQLGWWHFWDVWTQRGDKASLNIVASLASRALAIDGQDARAHMLAGIARFMTGDPLGSLGPLREAIALNPSLAVAHASIGSAHILSGTPAQSIEPLLAGMRLSPRDVYLFHAAGELAGAHLLLGENEKALEWCEKSLRLRPGYWYARMIAVCASVRLGRRDDAAHALRELLVRCPSFSESNVTWLPFTDRKWNQQLIAELRKAGLTSAARARRSG